MVSSNFESNVQKYLREIAGSARQAADALVEIGKMVKQYLDTEVDFAAMRASIDQLNELARVMENAQPGDQLKYAADADGKMKVEEWMHNLNVHYELVDPEGTWPTDQFTKDQFWAFIEALAETGTVRQVKVVRDANQLPIPQLIESLGIAETDFPRFAVGERVQVSDKTDENYLRVGEVEEVDNVHHRARVRFPESSEGVLVGAFHFLQLVIYPVLPDGVTAEQAGKNLQEIMSAAAKSTTEPHNNVNHCVAEGCDGTCGEEV